MQRKVSYMAIANRYQRTDRQVFFDELNSKFPDCNVEIDPKGKIWVFSYPTEAVFDDGKSLEANVSEAETRVHQFLIQSVERSEK
jgi:hypothetical protein